MLNYTKKLAVAEVDFILKAKNVNIIQLKEIDQTVTYKERALNAFQ